MRSVGIATTLAVLWLMWNVQGNLRTRGLEYLNWLPASRRRTVTATVLGAIVGAVAAWAFRGYDRSQGPTFPEVWIAITIGPLVEELIFRGYLFWALEWLFCRRVRHAGRLVGVTVAALFALSHLGKPGITWTQIASVFATGLMYGWMRLDSGSTVPPTCAHMAFNAVICLAATFL